VHPRSGAALRPVRLAPILRAMPSALWPSKIVCIGRNYSAHARELGNEVPERPLLFLKPPSALIGDGATIELPADSVRVEHEAEIGVFIGRRARHVSAAEALACVAGYAPLNDVTARDLQRLDVQFTRSKSYDTFCPVGTPQASADWRALEVIARVNGDERQHGRAADMTFGIPELIEFISRIMTLVPGDIIATGTPAGVGPLVAGDIVEIEVPGLGTIRNPVQAGSATTR
jgi:2-keto-4-pentenoate hydratase/2-oxohepta-3-ene-1,7-dioic acid hydratase in catechol pathway